MIVNIRSTTFIGMKVIQVTVQVQIINGLPDIKIVGLADKTVAESKERIRGALHSMGLALPLKRIIINLSPADLPKEGSHFDLPIACGILAMLELLPQDEISQYIIVGELRLDGGIIKVPGVLPVAIEANATNKGIICPVDNGKEANWSGNKSILAISSLQELVEYFKGGDKGIDNMSDRNIAYSSIDENIKLSSNKDKIDISSIIGQEEAKFGLELAAAGGHHMLMSGSPGSGKSILAAAMPSILPPMNTEEILSSSMIYSIADLLPQDNLIVDRPFRSPHHSCSVAAMVGGGVGSKIRPGEISFANNGVLFLDEFPEFPQQVIDALRQPIEQGKINISRAARSVEYPARFQLIAAMNPCKCGYLYDSDRACRQAPVCQDKYLSKISGPILDRFDITIQVEQHKKWCINKDRSEDSNTVQERVKKVRKIQEERYKGTKFSLNANASQDFLLESTENEVHEVLNRAVEKLGLSMRSCERVLRLSRTIADMKESPSIRKEHVLLAMSYRNDIIKR